MEIPFNIFPGLRRVCISSTNIIRHASLCDTFIDQAFQQHTKGKKHSVWIVFERRFLVLSYTKENFLPIFQENGYSLLRQYSFVEYICWCYIYKNQFPSYVSFLYSFIQVCKKGGVDFVIARYTNSFAEMGALSFYELQQRHFEMAWHTLNVLPRSLLRK